MSHYCVEADSFQISLEKNETHVLLQIGVPPKIINMVVVISTHFSVMKKYFQLVQNSVRWKKISMNLKKTISHTHCYAITQTKQKKKPVKDKKKKKKPKRKTPKYLVY